MKTAAASIALAFALLNPAWTGGAALAAQRVQDVTDQSCRTNKSNVTLCKRPLAQEAGARKPCRWKCRTECSGGQCIEICRGSGRECNGKIPPGW